jgi:hypothetical protein
VPTQTLLRLAQSEQEEGGAFDPEAIAVMSAAFEQILHDFKLTNRDDPLVERIATLVIELMRNGARDPDQVRKEVVGSVGDCKC